MPLWDILDFERRSPLRRAIFIMFDILSAALFFGYVPDLLIDTIGVRSSDSEQAGLQSLVMQILFAAPVYALFYWTVKREIPDETYFTRIRKSTAILFAIVGWLLMFNVALIGGDNRMIPFTIAYFAVGAVVFCTIWLRVHFLCVHTKCAEKEASDSANEGEVAPQGTQGGDDT